MYYKKNNTNSITLAKVAAAPQNSIKQMRTMGTSNKRDSNR